MSYKLPYELTVEDFKRFPVWGYTHRHEHIGPEGEMVVEPVLDLPVTTLDGRFIGTELTLGNGDCVWGYWNPLSFRTHSLQNTC